MRPDSLYYGEWRKISKSRCDLDSDEYSIVAFCKNATITRKRFSEKTIVAFTNSTVFILDFYI